MQSPRAAAFLDRDGTIIEDVHYLAAPEQIRLLPGAASAIARLTRAGIPVVVVTNQSGIARGLFDHEAYRLAESRLEALLAAEGARIDASYYCPHHPDFTGSCDCRKPGVALFDQAIRDVNIDASRSAFIGNRLHDVLPARHYGGRGILVPSPDTTAAERTEAALFAEVARTLGDALRRAFPG